MTTITWRRSGPRRVSGLLAALGVAAVSVGGATAASASPGVASARLLAGGGSAGSLLGDGWGSKAADAAGLAGDAVNHPQADPGSLFTVTRAVGARRLWQQTDPAGSPVTGAGVTVALLDSGVSPVPGLNAPGKITYGPDFTADAAASAGQDDFGHGTFMAGLIAANDASVNKDGTAVPVDSAAPAAQEGLAPGAGLLSVKLAGADGSTSVDSVIAGLSWVTAHRHDNGMNVRVVNLSFGATALQPYQVDPLAAAAEAAWRAGIVVVASVGNSGLAAGGVDDPALDPFVLAVGASDPQGKADGWDKPAVADFSSRGTTVRHADLLAPGQSLVSLRDPGSTIDVANPQGLVAGDSSGRLFRGSGTSQAAAVTSGAVALLLQAHPELTPDQVKADLTATAVQVKHANVLDAGAGQIDLPAALSAADGMAGKDKLDLAGAVQSYPASTGLDGVDVGDLGGSWDGARWNGARWNGARWNGARWNGARWNGARWNGARWNGARWSAADWS